MSCQFLPDYYDSSGDNPQFPIEFGNVLIWYLAAELASEYGLPPGEQGMLWQTAEFKLQQVLDYDVENASVIFALEYER